MSIKTTKRLALGVIASLVFAPLVAIAPASAALTTTVFQVNNSSATGFVGDAIAADVLVTTTGTPTASDDAFVLTVANTTTVTGATALTRNDAVDTGGAAPAASSFNLERPAAALTNWVDNKATHTLTLTAGAGAVALSGAKAGKLVFKANTPGVYTFTVTPSEAAAATPTLTPGVITFTVLSVGAVSGDGGAATTPFSTLNGVAGVANFVTIKATGAARTASALATQVVVTGGTMSSASAGTLSADKTSLVIDGVQHATTSGTSSTITIPTPTTGTITVKTYLQSQPGIFSTTAIDTVTITVNATAITNVFSAAKSTSYVGAGNTVSTTAAAETTVLATPIRVAATLSTADEAANVQVIQKDGNGTNLTSGFKTVTASITGGGLLGTALDTPTGASVSSAAGATTTVYVFPNGTSGNATLTVSLDGTVVETLTVSFYGDVTSLVATSKISSVNADGGALAGVIEVVARDANSILVPGATVTFDKAADATLVSTMTAAGDSDNDGDQLVGITPIAGKYGTTTVTVKSGTVISNAVTVVLAHNEVATATLALDKTTYLPGEKATLTLAAKDKNGLIVPDALDADGEMAFTSNLGLSAAMGTGTAAWVAGSYTQTIFAPQTTTPTDWIITVKLDTDAAFATALDGATLTAATVKVGFPVVVPEVVYEKPTLGFVVSGGRVFLSGTAENGEGDIIIYVKRVGTTAWKERAKTLEVAAPGDFNGSIKAPKGNVVIRVKQEGTGLFSNQVIIVK